MTSSPSHLPGCRVCNERSVTHGICGAETRWSDGGWLNRAEMISRSCGVSRRTRASWLRVREETEEWSDVRGGLVLGM